MKLKENVSLIVRIEKTWDQYVIIKRLDYKYPNLFPL
jgi:hypothetical protein